MIEDPNSSSCLVGCAGEESLCKVKIVSNPTLVEVRLSQGFDNSTKMKMTTKMKITTKIKTTTKMKMI